MQVMEFTKENVASYIAMVGVLSVLAQVSIIFFLQWKADFLSLQSQSFCTVVEVFLPWSLDIKCKREL